MRADLSQISRWIAPESQLLDLGCGDGTLLAHLAQAQNVTGYGVEIDDANITACIKKNLNVIQQNINDGLSNFASHAFDYVVMSQTLQAISHPDRLLDEMLRVGREVIVTFPNFAHWKCRSERIAEASSAHAIRRMLWRSVDCSTLDKGRPGFAFANPGPVF